MNSLIERVTVVHARQQRQWLWLCLSWGLVAGGAAGCCVGLVRLLASGGFSWIWIPAAIVACCASGLFVSFIKPRALQDAARAIDVRYRLKDRVLTALAFLLKQQDVSAIKELQIADANLHLENVDPVLVAPIKAPRPWYWGLFLTAAAFGITFLSNSSDPVVAAMISNEAVSSQADRLASGLAEIEKLHEQTLDPEVEQLLKELATKIDELKLPGVDPKEALAKLSEMESAILEMQQKLVDPATESKLQQVGEALSLAEPMQAAGQAMSEGNMEKAAEELEKIELPKLDRQMEKAIVEKLDQVQQNSSKDGQKKLEESIGQVSQGMSNGDRNKFQDGLKGLAGECKSQGRKKKLSDLLRKQCQCLGDCKGECEGMCKNSNGKGKGGKNWGTGASGNEPGEKTAQLKTGPQMNITGQESEQGDVDVETINSNEQQQEASRSYREKVDKYTQLSESVLDSEPLPLGHRQTIRRYFEMIRPQNSDTDSVNKSLQKKD